MKPLQEIIKLAEKCEGGNEEEMLIASSLYSLAGAIALGREHLSRFVDCTNDFSRTVLEEASSLRKSILTN